MKIIKLTALLILGFIGLTVSAPAQKMKAEEILAKHLDSIGSKEKRGAVKNRLVGGASEVIQKIPYKKLSGKALIVSEDDNLFFISSFNSTDYPLERIGYFSKKVTIPYVIAGNRSPLGGFLQDNNIIISEGLLTGSISDTWSLLDLENNQAKLETDGKKKINGREAYVLKYFPKSGISSDFSIKLFFDAETFQHVRSEYLYKLVAREAKAGTLGGNMDNGRRYFLTEDFGDFREADGLTLPHSYKIYLMMDAQTQTGTVEYEWNIAISQYLFNQKLDPGFFNFEEK